MKKYLLLLSVILTVQSVQALTYRAIANEDWDDPDAWDLNGVPNQNDDVIIDGFIITIPEEITATAKSVKLRKYSNQTGQSILIVKGVLNVNTTLELRSEYFHIPTIPNEIVLKIEEGIVNVFGDLHMFRQGGDKNTRGIYIDAFGSSELNITGNAFFTFKRSEGIPTTHSISFKSESTFTVAGDVKILAENRNIFIATFLNEAALDISGSYITTTRDEGFSRIDYQSSNKSFIDNNLIFEGIGTGLDTLTESIVNILGGHMVVGNDVTISSQDVTKYTKLNLTGLKDTLTVGRNIILSAVTDETVSLNMHHDGLLQIAGNIQRPNNYGGLYMHENSAIVFNSAPNSTSSTSLPSTNLQGSGNDHFLLNNIQINNTSGNPMTLEGPMEISNVFQLGDGIVQTDSINILIIEEGGSITGGSPTSYIDGPIEKRGTSNNQNVFMPLGRGSVYAPIELTPNTNPDGVYRARFLGDPPPIGGVLTPPITSLSNYIWEIDQNADSDPVDVELNWMDGQAAGVGQMDSIVVAYYTPATDTWNSMGIASSSGGSGPGQIGSVISDMAGDPPPIGGIFVTVGTVTTNSVLPLELTTFQAQTRTNQVELTWETTSEFNFSHFEVEHSSNGIDFNIIASIHAKGAINRTAQYRAKHASPAYGVNYYRLRQVDEDRSFTYSTIKAVSFFRSASIIAAPNPTHNQVRITGLDSGTERGQIAAYDHTGRMIYQGQMDFENGSVGLNLEALAVQSPGTYFLRVTDRQGVHNLTILKSK